MYEASSHSLVVKADGWMDVSYDTSYYIEEIENKGSQMGHTKKDILKNHKMYLNLCTYFLFT